MPAHRRLTVASLMLLLVVAAAALAVARGVAEERALRDECELLRHRNDAIDLQIRALHDRDSSRPQRIRCLL